MALPELTLEQRRAALNKAAAARKRRAEVSGQLKNKEINLKDVFSLAKEDEAIAKMRVTALLKSLPRVGPHRAQLAMEEVGIAPTRRIQGLGPVQRAALLRYFR